MIPKERQDKILEVLENEGYISVEELSSYLYVSLATVRRDLSELEKNGFLKRTHGGASAILKDHQETSIDYRSQWFREEKIKIGKEAAKLVDDNMNIFIDSSSTTMYFSKEILNKNNLNVLTNNISIAQILSKNSTNHIEVTCGTYDSKHGAIYGPDTAQYIKQRHADILFVSATGLSEEGVTTKSKSDTVSKQAFQKGADLTVLLMDHTKINQISYYIVYSLADIDIIICDEKLPEALYKKCLEQHINVIIV